MTTLDFDLITEPTPIWARACPYCTADDLGNYDEGVHLRRHLPLTCEICGEASPNRLLFEQGHGVNLGASWGSGYLLCCSLWLRLNHLTYDLLHGRKPCERDARALELGWLIAPDGAQLAPEGWPLAPPHDPYPGSFYLVREVPMKEVAT